MSSRRVNKDVRNNLRLKRRFWQDAPYAQMSSDGQRLFLLRDLEETTADFGDEFLRRGRNFGVAGGPPRDFNRLVALELNTEGKTLWTVGGPDSHEPALTSAFFLGAPLPLSGHVYAIVEMKDEIKLVSLDAATGQIGVGSAIGSNRSTPPSGLRRPTSIRWRHAVLFRGHHGVSDFRRSCDWRGRRVPVPFVGTQLPVDDIRRTPNRRGISGFYGTTVMNDPGNHWADAAAIISPGASC